MSAPARTTAILVALVTLGLASCGSHEPRTLAESPSVVTREYDAPIYAITFTASGDEIVTLEKDGRSLDNPGFVTIRPASGGAPSVAFVDSRSPSDVAVSPAGDVLAVVHDFGEVDLYTLPKAELIGATHSGIRST